MCTISEAIPSPPPSPPSHLPFLDEHPSHTQYHSSPPPLDHETTAQQDQNDLPPPHQSIHVSLPTSNEHHILENFDDTNAMIIVKTA